MKTVHICIVFFEYLYAFMGPDEMTTCDAIRRANIITVNEESLKKNRMSLQFFVDCSQPGDTIIFDTEALEPQGITVVRHPVVFDVANPNTSRVVLK